MAIHKQRFSRFAGAFFTKKSSLIPLFLVMLGSILLFNLLSGCDTLFTRSNPPFLLLTMQVYAADFSVGFISRVLVGEVISWFCPTVSLTQIADISRAAVLFSFVLQAALAAVVARKAVLRKDLFILPLLLIFVFHPFTCIQNVVLLGILDLYNLILFLIFFFYANRKIAVFLTPVFCFLGVLIHYQFAFAFFPGFFAVQLYLAAKDEKTDIPRLAGLLATLIVTAASTVYFAFFAKNSVTMTMEEFNEHLISRYSDYAKTGLLTEYFDYYVFKQYNGMEYASPFGYAAYLIKYALDRFEPRTFGMFVYFFLPIQAMLSSVWFYCARAARGIKRFAFTLFLIHPLLLAVTLVISTDRYRWFSDYVMTALIMLFCVYADEEPLLAQYRQRLQTFFGGRLKKICAALLFAAYTVSCIVLIHIIHIFR